MSKRVTKANAAKTLDLVAQWLGEQGYGPAGGGPAPTGRDAAYRGLGPELMLDWQGAEGGPRVAILLEGGPFEWAYACSMWVQAELDKAKVPVFVEPYAAWALCLYVG